MYWNGDKDKCRAMAGLSQYAAHPGLVIVLVSLEMCPRKQFTLPIQYKGYLRAYFLFKNIKTGNFYSPVGTYIQYILCKHNGSSTVYIWIKIPFDKSLYIVLCVDLRVRSI